MWTNDYLPLRSFFAVLLDLYGQGLIDFSVFFTAFDFAVLKLFTLGFAMAIVKEDKFQLFFAQSFYDAIHKILNLTIFSIPYEMAKIINTMKIKLMTYKEYCSNFFNDIMKHRFFIYLLSNYTIIMTIQEFESTELFTVSFKGLHNKNYTVNLVLGYVFLKLDQYYAVKEVIFPVIREFHEERHVLGFRFVVAGRMDRTERATYMLRKDKAMPLSEKATDIEYDDDSKILRYGVVGIKLWLNIKQFLPTHYKIKYLASLLQQRLVFKPKHKHVSKSIKSILNNI